MSERFPRGVAFTLDPAHFSGQSTSQADEIVLKVTRDDRGRFLIAAEQLAGSADGEG